MTTTEEREMTTTIRPTVDLYDCDGNAFGILARVERAFRNAGLKDQWPAVRDEMTSGDYYNLLGTVGKYCDISYDAPRPYCANCGDARIDKDNYCPECEYDNTDAISVCCVECGQRYPDEEWLDHNSTCDECVMYLEDIARQEAEDDEYDEDDEDDD
jgi:hypothetical protein